MANQNADKYWSYIQILKESVNCNLVADQYIWLLVTKSFDEITTILPHIHCEKLWRNYVYVFVERFRQLRNVKSLNLISGNGLILSYVLKVLPIFIKFV